MITKNPMQLKAFIKKKAAEKKISAQLVMQNYMLDASPAALGLASNEYVTEFMVSFGVVPANFRQVEAPKVYCNVVSWLTGGTQFTNQADAGGVYDGQWIMATTRWVTRVYKPSKPLPRTGY